MSLGMVCAEWLALCMFHNNFRKRIDVGEFVGKLVLGFLSCGRHADNASPYCTQPVRKKATAPGS